MPGKLTLDGLSKKIQSLKDRFERLEKDVRALKDLLNVHDNWHSTIRKWIGTVVSVCSRGKTIQTGTLKWSDRYNLCITFPESEVEGSKVRTRVYTKGGIDWIERKEG